MKLLNSLFVALCGFAGSALLASQACGATLVYTDGDVFLGFRSTSAPNDYLWDLGQFSQFEGKSIGTHLSLGNINPDMIAVFGSGWPTSDAIQWGAAGTHDFDTGGNQIVNLYATKAAPSTGGLASPWLRQSFSSQSNSSSRIETLAFFGFFGNDSTANNSTAEIQLTSGTSWASFNPGGANTTGGTSFDTWNPTVEAPTNPNSGGTGIPHTRLDLFKILPDNTGTNPPSVYLGSFLIDTAGNVSFDVLDANPTPTPTPTPTPSGTPTPTPSPTPTPTPTVTPNPTVTPTATPGPTPPLTGALANISTRLNVGTGDNVLIGGFIITGTGTKQVIVRALGSSLPVPGALADPVLSLFDKNGTMIATDDDWMTNANAQEITDSRLAPPDPHEAALLLPLQPNPYTAVVQGKDSSTGVGLLEVYDLESDSVSKIANISTRGFVQTGDGVMIAGVIITGESGANVLIRAIGPTLPLANALLDPSLEIYNGSGALMFTNDNWKDSQEAEIAATNLAPTNKKEAAVLATLATGQYTAIVRGVNGTTGNALVEVYRLSE